MKKIPLFFKVKECISQIQNLPGVFFGISAKIHKCESFRVL
jgi:hypothetical protein